MGDIIIKPKQEEDFYVLWSLNTDSPFAWGTRERLEALKEEYFPTRNREARFARADRTSTSFRGAIPEPSWESDDGYVYHGRFFIKNSRIGELCLILEKLPSDGSQDESAEILALMEPDE